MYNYRGGVYRDTTNDTEIDHDVEVVGWGEDDDGTPYWNVRNSWGAAMLPQLRPVSSCDHAPRTQCHQLCLLHTGCRSEHAAPCLCAPHQTRSTS